jgi:hypothetical protein
MRKKEILRLVADNGLRHDIDSNHERKRKYNFNGIEIFRLIERGIDKNTKTIISFFLLFLAADIFMLHLTGDNQLIATAVGHLHHAAERLIASDLGYVFTFGGGGGGKSCNIN